MPDRAAGGSVASRADWAAFLQNEDPRRAASRVPPGGSKAATGLELLGEIDHHCPQCGLRISRTATLPRSRGDVRRQGIRCGFDM